LTTFSGKVICAFFSRLSKFSCKGLFYRPFLQPE
jgi:hypothetical protein